MHNALHNGLARYLSPDQLEALRAARVGIAGAGGLGSNAALMLARSGVGNLVLVDDDVVDASNLTRQQYWPRHVGRPKVEALAELLLEKGYEQVSFKEKADVYIINTCAVTNTAGSKSRQKIHAAIALNPEALIAVVGCYAQTASEQLEQDANIDILLGSDGKSRLADMIEEGLRKKRPQKLIHDVRKVNVFEALPIHRFEHQTRAFLKIQDGCNQFCSYCIIPYARGPVRSLPLEEAVRQTEQLRREGYREVVFTGIELSSWGQDLKDGRSLIDLLEAVSQAAGEMRLRLGSLEPRTVTEDFCRRAARLPNLCPQFHLSMQSGCDATLRRMNRRYDTARFLRSVALLRQYFLRPAITTDLICGFPGETEEEFSQTLAFLRRCDFAQMHIFPYSIRPGTKAAEMEQVPGPVKEERAARASAVAAELHRAYLQGCVGQTYPVLFEQRKDGCAAGHAPNYMPVEVQTQEDYHNTVRHVKVTGVVNDILMGEVT